MPRKKQEQTLRSDSSIYKVPSYSDPTLVWLSSSINGGKRQKLSSAPLHRYLQRQHVEDTLRYALMYAPTVLYPLGIIPSNDGYANYPDEYPHGNYRPLYGVLLPSYDEALILSESINFIDTSGAIDGIKILGRATRIHLPNESFFDSQPPFWSSERRGFFYAPAVINNRPLLSLYDFVKDVLTKVRKLNIPADIPYNIIDEIKDILDINASLQGMISPVYINRQRKGAPKNGPVGPVVWETYSLKLGLSGSRKKVNDIDRLLKFVFHAASFLPIGEYYGGFWDNGAIPGLGGGYAPYMLYNSEYHSVITILVPGIPSEWHSGANQFIV